MPLLFAVMILATARCTRIVTDDTITASLRLRIWRRFPPAPKGGRRAHPIGQLIDCPWCTGWWVAGAVVAFAANFTTTLDGTALALLAWPAVAEAAALLALWLDK